MPQSFLGRDNWAPNGFVNPADERIQDFYTEQGQLPQLYSYVEPYNGRQIADFTGNSFGYIPTEIELASAVALRNMMAVTGETPFTPDDPQQNQILQQLYQGTAQFWEDIRNASGTAGSY